MKLSEAIRLGSLMKPQGHGMLLMDGRTCALGAAMDALGLPMNTSLAPWPSIAECKKIETCPVCEMQYGGLGCVVVCLNDVHLWTREQIADWVEQIENQESETILEREAAEIETLK